MATLVDYMVISDGSFALNPGESKTFQLPIPNNFVVGTNRARPILAFKYSNPKSQDRYSLKSYS